MKKIFLLVILCFAVMSTKAYDQRNLLQQTTDIAGLKSALVMNQKLIILSFGQDRVVVNMGLLNKDEVKISKRPVPVKFNTLYSEQETEYKDVRYTPNFQRPITIIDPETTEEVKPVVYFDKDTNEVRGKCKLKPYKSYFVFEVREDNN